MPINTAVQVMQAMQNGEYAPQTQDQTQTQDGYAYPQEGSGGYAYPDDGSGGYAYPDDGSGYSWPY